MSFELPEDKSDLSDADYARLREALKAAFAQTGDADTAPDAEAPPIVVYGYSSERFAKEMADSIDATLARVSHRQHPDDEIEPELLSNIQGRNVIFVASGSGDPSKQMFEAQTMLSLINSGGPKSLTGVFPYMWYNAGDDKRGQRKAQTAVIAIENVRTHLDHAIVIRPHNNSITNATFEDALNLKRCIMPHMAYALGVQLADLCEKGTLDPDDIVFVNADAGAGKRNGPEVKEALYRGMGEYAPKGADPEKDLWPTPDKLRGRDSGETQSAMKGDGFDVEGKVVVTLEDMIRSAGTLTKEFAPGLKQAGAKSIIAYAPHGLFPYDEKKGQEPTAAIDRINNSDLDLVIIGNGYDFTKTDDIRHQAIQESPKIIEMDYAPYIGLIAQTLLLQPTKALVEEAKRTGVERTSVSAIEGGRHPALTERQIVKPVPLPAGNPLFEKAGEEPRLDLIAEA